MSEVPEFIGGEHILAHRAATPEVGQQILDVVHRFEDDMRRVGEEIRNGNPTPGNKAGGITTLEEKSLGCEGCQMDWVVEEIQKRTNKPIKTFIIQECGGTIKTVEMAVRAAKEMVQEMSMQRREEFPICELVLGTECGGSDPTSGIASNPLIG